jgi:hypothetical protein
MMNVTEEILITSQPLARLLLDSSSLFRSTNQLHQIQLSTDILPHIRPPKWQLQCLPKR